MKLNYQNAVVDVILPTFNGEKYVESTIDSVLSQTVSPILNLIVVDDFSSDKTVLMVSAKMKKEDRIKIIRNNRNFGNAYSRNLGLRYGNSEYVAFIDQDDLWEGNKLEIQLNEFYTDKKLQYAVSLQEFLIQNPHDVPSWFNKEWANQPQLGYLPSSLMARRDLFVKVGFFQEDLRTGSDLAWFAKARKLGIHHKLIEKPLVKRRIHENNLSSNPHSNHEILRILKSHLEDK